MPTRIRWLNPIGTNAQDAHFAEMLGAIKRLDTELNVVSLVNESCRHHLEYQTYEGLVWSDIIRAARETGQAKFDAMVIGCFYDPALVEAREIAGECVVTAPCEASVKLASSLGSKFSVIVGRKKWIPRMESTIAHYGCASRLASMREIGLGVEEMHLNNEDTSARLTAAAVKAVEHDGAEVIILGSTSEWGFDRRLQADLRARFGALVPVLDCSVAALKYAELLAEAKVLNGWSPSRVNGGEAPPEEREIQAWKVFDGPAAVADTLT